MKTRSLLPVGVLQEHRPVGGAPESEAKESTSQTWHLARLISQRQKDARPPHKMAENKEEEKVQIQPCKGASSPVKDCLSLWMAVDGTGRLERGIGEAHKAREGGGRGYREVDWPRSRQLKGGPQFVDRIAPKVPW